MIDRSEIDSLIEVMKAAFPNFHPGLGTPAIYEQLLGDLDRDELRAAVLACCSEPGRAFAPSVGEIRGAVMDIRRQARGLPSALDAWGEVQRQIIDVGHTGKPAFSVPLIAEVVSRFGWNYLCMSEDGMVDRAHFLKAYELAMQDQMRRDVQLPAVTRYVEEHGQARLTAGVEQLAGRLKA